MMWKVERDGDYFKIFDEKKNIAGYFAPEYGDIFPEEKVTEVIEEMHKKHEKIHGGYLMVPMIKFGVFNLDQEIELPYLQARINEAQERIVWWQKFISELKNSNHKIRVSHTDPDMLSITFSILFDTPVRLENNDLLNELKTILDLLSDKGLL